MSCAVPVGCAPGMTAGRQQWVNRAARVMVSADVPPVSWFLAGDPLVAARDGCQGQLRRLVLRQVVLSGGLTPDSVP